MALIGIGSLSVQAIEERVRQGWRFLQFEETKSFLVVTRRTYSDIYFVGPNESHMRYAKKHIVRTAFLGWWGIPWGLVGTPVSILRNLRGGQDLIHSVMSKLS
jgi:hypothetical protein